MADTVSPEQRSLNMSHIRAKDTLPEIQVRRYLHANGFRYRLHVASLPGKPDIVLHKYKTVVFIHGCFWHKHSGCKYYRLPKTNSEYWSRKIVERDEINLAALQKNGWRVLIVWECELKYNTQERLVRLCSEIKKA